MGIGREEPVLSCGLGWMKRLKQSMLEITCFSQLDMLIYN
jgi:hypothetical protein